MWERKCNIYGLLACRIRHKLEHAQCEMIRLTCGRRIFMRLISSLSVLKWIKFQLWNVILQFLQKKKCLRHGTVEQNTAFIITPSKKQQQYCKFVNTQRVMFDTLGDIRIVQQFWRVFFFLLFNHLENRKTYGEKCYSVRNVFYFSLQLLFKTV
jgi:hypothetical protein